MLLLGAKSILRRSPSWWARVSNEHYSVHVSLRSDPVLERVSLGAFESELVGTNVVGPSILDSVLSPVLASEAPVSVSSPIPSTTVPEGVVADGPATLDPIISPVLVSIDSPGFYLFSCPFCGCPSFCLYSGPCFYSFFGFWIGLVSSVFAL